MAPPIPTASQLVYQQNEIMALIHFNMGSFVGNNDPSCGPSNWNEIAEDNTYPVAGISSDPNTFDPAQLNISNWAEVMKDLGAKHSVRRLCCEAREAAIKRGEKR